MEGERSAHAEPGPSALGRVERYRLQNGLRVVLAPDRVTPGISVVVHYGVGTAHAPPAQRGISHLVEHLTFRGSLHLAPLQGSAVLHAIGAKVNAATTLESTDYFTQLPASALETVLWVESERMGFTLGGVDQAALDIERRIVSNEQRLRRRSFNDLIERYWLPALYGEEHPFVGGQNAVDTVDAVTLGAVQWFFQTHYRPDNATLVLVGQFEIARARESIEKYFGPIVSPPIVRTSLPIAAPRPCGVHRVQVSHAGVFGDVLRLTWPLPLGASALQQASVEFVAQLLERRLRTRLVKQGADTAAVHVSLWRFSTHQLLNVDLQLREHNNALAVERVARTDAALLATKELPAPELEAVRLNLISRWFFEREDGSKRALALAEGRDPDGDAEALPLVTAQDVRDAARPFTGGVLALHAYPSRAGHAQSTLEQKENPCP